MAVTAKPAFLSSFNSKEATQSMAFFSREASDFKLAKAFLSKSVSYTHLDVYKRQPRKMVNWNTSENLITECTNSNTTVVIAVETIIF